MSATFDIARGLLREPIDISGGYVHTGRRRVLFGASKDTALGRQLVLTDQPEAVEATFFSIGWAGRGLDLSWGALNQVPEYAESLILSFYTSGATADPGLAAVYIGWRPIGSAAGAALNLPLTYKQNAASAFSVSDMLQEVEIPVANGGFELYYNRSGTANPGPPGTVAVTIGLAGYTY